MKIRSFFTIRSFASRYYNSKLILRISDSEFPTGSLIKGNISGTSSIRE